MDAPERRCLDGVFFRVERDGRWESVCFTDLTADEQAEVTEGKSAEWLRSLAMHLAHSLRAVGDQLDVTGYAQE